jgi:hypothetical protein
MHVPGNDAHSRRLPGFQLGQLGRADDALGIVAQPRLVAFHDPKLGRQYLQGSASRHRFNA